MENDEVNKAAKGFLDERFYLDWWNFNYANRNLFYSLLDKGKLHEFADEVFLWLEEIAYEYTALTPNYRVSTDSYHSQLIELSNCLVYSYHKLANPSAPLNPRYESLLGLYDYPFEKLHPKEVETVKTLHDMTIRLGYLVVPLCLEPNSEICWNAFVEKSPTDIHLINTTPLYVYERKGSSPNDIQGAIAPELPVLDGDWNLVIYYHAGKALSHFKKQIEARWNDDGILVIGKSNGYKVAVYANRKLCSRRKVFEVLRSKVALLDIPSKGRKLWLSFGIDHKVDGITSSQRTVNEISVTEILERQKVNVTDYRDKAALYSITQHQKKLMEINCAAIKSLKLDDPRLKQRWDLEKSNVRRAIGLYHWDQAKRRDALKESGKSFYQAVFENIVEQRESGKDESGGTYKYDKKPSRKALMRNTIDILKEVQPSVLEFYYRGFNREVHGNKIMWGDGGVRDSIVEAMEADYALTKHCIEQVGYDAPYGARKARMKRKN